MTAAAARPSDLRAFFGALAVPVLAGAILAVALVVSGPDGPAFALTLNLFVLFEVAGFSQSLGLPAPMWYLRPGRFERRWIYDCLGVGVSRRLMRSRVYRRANPNFRLKGGRAGFAELRQTMDAAEIAHGLVFIAVTAVAAGAAALSAFSASAWLMLFNLLLNGYPMMLQRYNRLRLERLAGAERRSATLF